MGYATARAAIETRWRTLWTADSVVLRAPTCFGTSTVWLTRVDATASLIVPPHTTPWVRHTTVFGASLQAEIRPNPFVRTSGRVWLQFFAPKNQGRGALDALIDLAVPIYERRQFAGLSFEERQWVGATEEDQWWTSTLSVPFDFDEVSPDA